MRDRLRHYSNSFHTSLLRRDSGHLHATGWSGTITGSYRRSRGISMSKVCQWLREDQVDLVKAISKAWLQREEESEHPWLSSHRKKEMVSGRSTDRSQEWPSIDSLRHGMMWNDYGFPQKFERRLAMTPSKPASCLGLSRSLQSVEFRSPVPPE